MSKYIYFHASAGHHQHEWKWKCLPKWEQTFGTFRPEKWSVSLVFDSRNSAILKRINNVDEDYRIIIIIIIIQKIKKKLIIMVIEKQDKLNKSWIK